MKRILLIICMIIIMSIINCYAGAQEDFKDRYLLIGEKEGDKSVYLDKYTIKRSNGIANINMINKYVKGGSSYYLIKSSFPNDYPSYSETNASFDCNKIMMKLNTTVLYNSSNIEYDRQKLNDKWNQLQIKETVDKIMFQEVCKTTKVSIKSSNKEAQWKLFVSDDKKFSVKFPTEPDKESNIVNAPSGKVKLIQYMSKYKDVHYAVMYGDFPANALVGWTSEQLLDNGRDGAVENVQGKLLSEVIISKDNCPGREITVKVEPNTVITAQIILKDNRVYQVLVTTPSDKLFISKRREFFNSFKMLD